MIKGMSAAFLHRRTVRLLQRIPDVNEIRRELMSRQIEARELRRMLKLAKSRDEVMRSNPPAMAGK